MSFAGQADMKFVLNLQGEKIEEEKNSLGVQFRIRKL